MYLNIKCDISILIRKNVCTYVYVEKIVGVVIAIPANISVHCNCNAGVAIAKLHFHSGMTGYIKWGEAPLFTALLIGLFGLFKLRFYE